MPKDREQSLTGCLPFCNAHVKLGKVPRASDLGPDWLECCEREGREEQVDRRCAVPEAAVDLVDQPRDLWVVGQLVFSPLGDPLRALKGGISYSIF